MKCVDSKAGYLLVSVTSQICSATRFFWKSLRNTAYFAVGTLTLQLPIALLLAILLNSKFVKGKNFLRLAFFAPVLVAGVFVAIIFNLVYDQRAGLVNQEFVLFGKEIGWLNEENM